MNYVHYWHFQKAWYAEVRPDAHAVRQYWHNSAAIQRYWNKEYLVEGSEGLTHSEIKKLIAAKYPGLDLVKDIPYHEGRRWFGYKVGSRK